MSISYVPYEALGGRRGTEVLFVGTWIAEEAPRMK